MTLYYMLKQTYMKKVKLERIKAILSKYPSKEKREIADFLRNDCNIFDEHVKVDACPHCDSKHIVKNGTRNGHNKYVCRNCKKNFTYRTNTILSGIQKINKWNLFVEDFMSLHITPLSELKVKLGVSEQTVFNWRHKLLSALETKEPKFINEVIEFDDANFLISRKGRQNMGIDKRAARNWRKHLIGDHNYNAKVFVTYGRTSKNLELCMATMGKINKKDMYRYFTDDKFKDYTVMSDKHLTYRNFFEQNNIKHHAFKAEYHRDWVNKEVHTQTINRYISDFKEFVNKYLRGVSTKYMPDYLKWFMFIHDTKVAMKKQSELNKKMRFNIADNICGEVLKEKTGLELYRQLEYSYEMFLKQNGRTDYGKCKNHYYSGKIAC